LLLSETFSEQKFYKNVFAAGAPPRASLGELTTLPKTFNRQYVFPFLCPLDAFGVSNARFSALLALPRSVLI